MDTTIIRYDINPQKTPPMVKLETMVPTNGFGIGFWFGEPPHLAICSPIYLQFTPLSQTLEQETRQSYISLNIRNIIIENKSIDKMSYLSRACMATTVAVIEGSTSHSSRWNFSGHLQPINAGNRRHFSSVNSPDDGFHAQAGDEENRRKEAEESLQKVMYLNCWAQN
jgi:hypothetical protein